jgi:hypothetical protein
VQLTVVALVLVIVTSAAAKLETTTTTLELPTTTSSVPEVTTTTVSKTTTTSTTTLPGLPCVNGDLGACDDGNPCTLDFCDPISSRCVYTLLNNTPCTDDGVFCTVDLCVSGVCQHAAADFRCDLGECVVRACRPNDAQTDRRGCILVTGRQPEGQPCTDDGFACTDDVCLGGSCLHLPVDSRCDQVAACRAAACTPQQPDRDETGCAPGPPRAEGEQCSEDADPCTVDVCRAGACSHETTVDAESCFPLQDVFRRAIALGTLTRELTDMLAGVAPDRFASALAALDRVQSDLDAAVAVLAGRETLETAAAGDGSTLAGMDPSERAHIAFTTVLRTPQQVSLFLQSLAQARARAALGRPTAGRVRRRGRLLLRTTRALRWDLRSLQR